MTKTKLTILALVLLAACDATIATTGAPTGDMRARGSTGAYPPNAQRVDVAPR